jgi:hypothetical protein
VRDNIGGGVNAEAGRLHAACGQEESFSPAIRPPNVFVHACISAENGEGQRDHERHGWARHAWPGMGGPGRGELQTGGVGTGRLGMPTRALLQESIL